MSVRYFRGRRVKRTETTGSQIKVKYFPDVRGERGECLIVPLEEFLREVVRSCGDDSGSTPAIPAVLAVVLAVVVVVVSVAMVLALDL